MSLQKALLAATCLALPVAAQAQPITGLYVGAGAGLNLLQEVEGDLSSGFATPRGVNVQTDAGWAGVVSLGWGFGNGVRAEIEVNYRSNIVDSVANGASSGGSGTVSSYGVMANALYDFDLGPGMPVTPYVGLGAGHVWQNWHRARNATVTLDGGEGSFAYQAIVGAALPLNDVAPGLALTAEYRFVGTLATDVDATSGTTRGTAEVTTFNHSVLLGLRYAFNASAPAPAPVAAPAAAPAPARTFLVFFDFDRADLTDRARAIIAEAAQNAQRTGAARIEVAGHADRSGTPQYNQRLSERRAQAVAAELERRGVARSALSIQAFGESRPLVPTADGVREPQNRRVEIVLR
jgi:outer membrane protein OmpA-like peptidoglycan-associated protein